MKFEQAFYTFGLNQLSKYKEGLGICAASRLDQPFLDKCLSLGSCFSSEYDPRTAEFVLYSKDFRAFVGVGISPRRDGGDGRTNKLCHFFIPAESELGQEPERYLLEYPFRKVVADREELAQVELGEAVYDYRGILEKYALQGDKFALLLWKSFLCAFDELEHLVFVIDRTKHGIEEYGKMAREITWLIIRLLPIPDDQRNLYRSRISYGVYTKDNVKAVRFVFTEDEETDSSRFYIDSEPESGEPIPQVFKAMARWAETSREYLQEKLTEMMQWRFSGKLQSSQMTLMYFRWKLEVNDSALSYDELKEEMDSLLLRSMSSSWHKQFLVKYLKQEEMITIKGLIPIWTDFILPEAENYGGMNKGQKQEFEDAVVNVVCMMRVQSCKNYHLFLEQLPETSGLKRQVLHNIFLQRDGREYIQKELKECSAIKPFCRLVSIYSDLCDIEEWRKELLHQSLFWYHNAGRGERKSISSVMNKLDQNVWKNEVKCYAADGYKGAIAYMAFLETEMDSIEPDYADFYYGWFVYFLRSEYKDVWAERGRIQEKEKALRDIGIISESNIREFNKYIGLIEEEAMCRQIEGKSLEEYAKWDIRELKYDACLKQWVGCVTKKMETLDSEEGENISDEIFCKLAEKIEYIISTGRISKDQYMGFLTALGAIAGRDVVWGVRFRLVVGEKEKPIQLPDFWEKIRPEENEFERLYAVLGDYKEPDDIEYLEELSTRGIFIRDCYAVWRHVKENVELLPNAEYLDDTYKEEWKKFVKRQKSSLLERSHPDQKEVYNFIMLQLWNEKACGGSLADGTELCAMIRKFRKTHVSFAKAVQNTPCFQKSEMINRRHEDMRLLLEIMESAEREVQESNAAHVVTLLESCPDRFRSAEEIKRLEEEYKEIMDIYKENNVLKEEKQRMQDEKEKSQRENQRLREENDKLLRQLDAESASSKRLEEEILSILRGLQSQMAKLIEIQCGQDNGGAIRVVSQDRPDRRIQTKNIGLDETSFSGSRSDVKNGKYN